MAKPPWVYGDPSIVFKFEDLELHFASTFTAFDYERLMLRMQGELYRTGATHIGRALFMMKLRGAFQFDSIIPVPTEELLDVLPQQVVIRMLDWLVKQYDLNGVAQVKPIPILRFGDDPSALERAVRAIRSGDVQPKTLKRPRDRIDALEFDD